jgi:hypothetical protein
MNDLLSIDMNKKEDQNVISSERTRSRADWRQSGKKRDRSTDIEFEAK